MTPKFSAVLATAFLLAALPCASNAAPVEDKAALAYQKPVKTLIGAIRYKKDAIAMKTLAIDEMAQALLSKHLSKMSAAEQKEFAAGLGTLIGKLSFPKAREMFQHIDTILYDPAKAQGDKVQLKSTIVVYRSYKKKELVLLWTLLKKKNDYQILDVTTAGESTLEGIREEQVDPLVKEGGTKLLMQKLRAKLAEVK